MHRIGLCPILWLLLELSAWAQDISAAWVQAPTAEARQTIRSLGLGFVEQQEGDWYLVHGHARSLLELEQSGIPWRPAPTPMTSSPTDGYRDPLAMRETVQDLASENPDLVTQHYLEFWGECGTSYVFEIQSTDADGNTSTHGPLYITL